MKYLAMSILAIRAMVALFAGKSFVNALRPLGFEFSGILPAKLYLVLYILATKAIGCLGG